MPSLLFHNLSVPKANSSGLIRFTRIGMKMTPLGTYLLCAGERESSRASLNYKKEKWADVRPEESRLVQRVWPEKSFFLSKRSREVPINRVLSWRETKGSTCTTTRLTAPRVWGPLLPRERPHQFSPFSPKATSSPELGMLTGRAIPRLPHSCPSPALRRADLRAKPTFSHLPPGGF